MSNGSRRSRTLVVALLAGAGIVLAAVLALALSRPRLEVSPEPPLRRDRPLDVAFLLSNAGRWLTARDVRAVCYLRDFRVETGGGLRNVAATAVPWEPRNLDPGETRELSCTFGSWPAEPRMADLLILSTYSVPGFPRPTVGCTRFVGEYAGEWRWTRRACPDDARTTVDDFLSNRLPTIDLSREFVP